ncbi:MAG: hypothetical protein GDA35_00260 [Hyphomonadaceae bacterium]|nr:hypothetical protein [Hyphomonadaceae bacterium]
MKKVIRNIMAASVAGLALAACSDSDDDVVTPPPPPPPPPADTAMPAVSFSPATLTVDSGGTGSSTLAATDNVGVTTGPTVTCDQGTFADDTYTAPVVSADTMATCTATASDAANNEGTGTLTISITREMTAPVVAFSPDALVDVASGATVELTVTAMDDVDGDLVPEVTCKYGSFDSDNNTYTAPVLSADTDDVTCTATATDAAGNAGTATITISVAAETEPPVITFTPATLDVASGATGMSTLAATDNLDDTVAPEVTCDAGSFADNTYTAPVVSVDTEATCTAMATDAAGNEGEAELTISVAREMTAPEVAFEPNSVPVQSGETVSVTLTATDDVDGTVVPTVTCTNGSFDVDAGTYTAPDLSAVTTATCTATATDAAGNESAAATLSVIIAAETTPPVITFSRDTLGSVASGATAALTVTATDNVDGELVPVVTCDAGSFNLETNTYTAPVVSVDTEVTCTATATDAVGNEGTGTLTFTVAAETTQPVVTFEEPVLVLASGGTDVSVVTVTDNVDGMIVPVVTCDGGGSFNVETNTYTAPDLSADSTLTCTATATDAAGNAGTATLRITVARELVRPVVSFAPATLEVASGATATSILAVQDNVSIVPGSAAVTCDRGRVERSDFSPDPDNDNPDVEAYVATITYSAPVLSADAMATCTATVSDGAGNTGTGTLAISIARETEPPTVTFSPDTLTVDSGGAVVSTLTAMDNLDSVVVPVVTCTDGGSFANGTYTAPLVNADTEVTCTATATDAAGNEGTATLTVSVARETMPPVITFSPDLLEVLSGMTVENVTVTARDPDGTEDGDKGVVETGAGRLTVECDQEGFLNTNTNTYTAPVVNAPTTATCTATVTDLAGNEGTATLTVLITLTSPPTPPTPPSPDSYVRNISPDPVYFFVRGSVVSSGFYDELRPGQTLTPVQVSASRDDLVLIRGADGAVAPPQVECTNGGRFRGTTFIAPRVTETTYSVCTATTPAIGGVSREATLVFEITPAPRTPTCPAGFSRNADLSGELSDINDPKVVCTIRAPGGVLTGTTELRYIEGVVYELDGRVDVGAADADSATCAGVTSARLVIRPGVTVVADQRRDLLVVNRCHRIEAVGTQDRPIRFWSNGSDTWGGIVILGNAGIGVCNVEDATPGTAGCQNAVSGVTAAAGGALWYGGAGEMSNSGMLQYVTVSGATGRFDRRNEQDEAVSFTPGGVIFAGVGNGTTVDRMQVELEWSGDNASNVAGMTLLGGNVNMSRVVLAGTSSSYEYLDAEDNMTRTGAYLDIRNGYSGRIQRLLIDGRGSSQGQSIRVNASNPVIRNFTLVEDARDNTRWIGGVGTYRDGVVINTSTDGGDACVGGPEEATLVISSVHFYCNNMTPPSILTERDVTTGIANGVNGNVVSSTIPDFVDPPSPYAVFLPVPETISVSAGRYPGAFNPDTETLTGNWTTGWVRSSGTNYLSPRIECPMGTSEAPYDIFDHNVCVVSATSVRSNSGVNEISDADALVRLTRGNLYRLDGRVDIGVDGGDTAELVIEPGVTVFGRNNTDYLVVNGGSTITANGTAANPIIFTSEEDVTGARGGRDTAAGDWGGLVILGSAPITNCDLDGVTPRTVGCQSSIYASGYGGGDVDDDSGSLSYVQVRYAGFGPFDSGITLAGVGRGTTVKSVQVHNTEGNGIRYLGGTVDPERIVLTGNTGRQLHIDGGYLGGIQRLVGVQNGVGVGGIEVGGNLSNPYIANFTLVGTGDEGPGIRVRDGAIGTWLNGVVTSDGACLDYQPTAGDGIEGLESRSDPEFWSVLFDCAGGLLTPGSDRTTALAAVNSASANNETEEANTLVNGFFRGRAERGVRATPIPLPPPPANAPASPPDAALEGGLDYIGAVENASDTWWQGWTYGLENSDSE